MAFDVLLANQLAGVCEWIYSDHADGTTDATEKLAMVCGVRNPGPRATSYGAIVEREGKLVVAFRGTEPTVEDWTRDIEATPVPFTVAPGVVGMDATTLPGIAHFGFLLEMNAVLPAIVATLRAKHPGRSVFVTGHSQGGAVAVLASIALEAAGIGIDGVYTFEAARAGDRTLCDSVPRPCYRIEYGNDVVPHVPPDGLTVEKPLKTLRAIAAGFRAIAASAGGGPPSSAISRAAEIAATAESVVAAAASGFVSWVKSLFSKRLDPTVVFSAAWDGASQLLADDALRTLLASVRRTGVTKYRSAGDLVYLQRGSDAADAPVTILAELSPAEAEDLFFRRLQGLFALNRSRNVKDLFEHHGVTAWRKHLKA
jgi:hypothetical protein